MAIALQHTGRRPLEQSPRAHYRPATKAERRLRPNFSKSLSGSVVRVKGLEPPLPYGKQILSLPRLPFRHARLPQHSACSRIVEIRKCFAKPLASHRRRIGDDHPSRDAVWKAGCDKDGAKGRVHVPSKSISSQLRNGVLLRTSDYINASGCATRVQSLFRP
jgi:hypothetical protein